MIFQHFAVLLLQLDVSFLLRETTPVAKFVLSLLLVLSIWSWGIILAKALLLRKVRREKQ